MAQVGVESSTSTGMSNVCRPYRGGLGDNIGAEVLGFRSRATRMTARRSAAVYEFPDRLIIIVDHLTEAGFWRAGLPVVRLLTSAADPDNPKGIYNDAGIEALQRRGVMFLT